LEVKINQASVIKSHIGMIHSCKT